jgi:hypothetical protein
MLRYKYTIFREKKCELKKQLLLESCYCYDMIYLLTAIGLSSGGSTHLHTNNTQNNTNNNRTTQIQTNVEELFIGFADL